MGKLLVLALAIGLAGCTKGAEIPISAPAPPPSPNSAAAQIARPWHHVGGNVPEAKILQDQAKCRLMGQMAPIDAGSRELKAMLVFIECMKAEGYAPD